ncbi:MAG: hypothetical protein GF375_06075 [Candidatus Omnitrophica bacterium]|nr:hypothetical protein [Candidatus Omnitrophota bacterium]MBD3269543.1 hypothetical protein [Candidatus Omnitrophota bacterium]
MNNKYIILFVAVSAFFLLSHLSSLTAQNQQEEKVSGIVEEVSVSGDYIVVDGKKYFLSEDLAIDYFIEEGDNVELTVINTERGPEVVELGYLFDSEEDLTSTCPEEYFPSSESQDNP